MSAVILLVLAVVFTGGAALRPVSTGAADTPVIESVVLSGRAINAGESITVTITARSISPVYWLNVALVQPDGSYLYGYGSAKTFEQVGQDTWVYRWREWTDVWAPAGVYTWTHISVVNAARQESAMWPPETFSVSNSNEAVTPVIESVTLSRGRITNGGFLTVTVLARSNAPVNWLNAALARPDGGYVYGGGSGRLFEPAGADLWRYAWGEGISSWAPSGVYTYTNVSVRNAGQKQSAVWPAVTFTVSNTNIAWTPILESVSVSPRAITNGGVITLTVIAMSNAPVYWLNSALVQPDGSYLYGYGSTTAFQQIGQDTWRHQHSETISPWLPAGVYRYRGISVMNEGWLTSAAWPDIAFSHTRATYQAYLPRVKRP